MLYHCGMADETPAAQGSQSNLPEYSVSELASSLKRAVEDAFPYVRVRGEISGLKFNSSGHVYFDLKDDKAVLNAVMWRTTAQRLKIKPEPGLEVVCTGRVSTYPASSRYQLIVDRMELAGLGALMAMLEARKKKLAAEGLFDAARKKRIPFLPRSIGIVTSPTGAVIRDIMHRLRDRCPRPVMVWPVAVQGDRAPAEIAAAIRGFNRLPKSERPDVIIVARGGGSFEDLLAFSEEEVVRAAAESAIPLISGVGHETDTTLIDLAADKRAPTPTAAAEMAVPVLRELAETLLSLQRRGLRAVLAPAGFATPASAGARPRAAPGGCALRTAAPALRHRRFPAARCAVPEPPAPSRGLHAGGGTVAPADRRLRDRDLPRQSGQARYPLVPRLSAPRPAGEKLARRVHARS